MVPSLKRAVPSQEQRSAVLRTVSNVVREPSTCRVCTAPVCGFELCWPCAAHQRIPGVADVVAPLTYAVASTESAELLSKYKNHPVRAHREWRTAIIADLLGEAIRLHETCFGVAAGLPVSVRTVVPSLTWRSGTHPLISIAESVGLLHEPVLTPGPDPRCDRTVRLDKFAVERPNRIADRHVLVIDDVWTTGSNAQSAALTLHRTGAARVSVLVIGRWLNPRNALTRSFIHRRLGATYDPHSCPVTGGACPEPPTSYPP